MISFLSKKITYFIISTSNTSPDSDQIEVYIYGLECFLNTGFTICILFIWGLFTNTIPETICWIVAFSVLRHHVGGLHAHTQLSCILSSCLMGISNWMVIAYIPYQSTIALLICAICIVTFMLYAPLDTPKYKLTHSMAKKEKIYSILIILIEFLICIVLKNKLSVSILYSDICVYILFVIRKLITSPFFNTK